MVNFMSWYVATGEKMHQAFSEHFSGLLRAFNTNVHWDPQGVQQLFPAYLATRSMFP